MVADRRTEGGDLISTDYLVVGSGASGLAFADTLVDEEPDVELTLIDRRPGPGGHWLDAYPFVRLHTPSAYYGVNSLTLGEDRIDQSGENAGFYERATGAEVRDYFAEVASRLTQTGRVRILTEHEHLGPGEHGAQVRDLSTGALHDVEVRRKLVDARYLEASIPATHEPSFDVASGARVVPVNDLPAAARPGSRYTVLGSGKTAVDACTWLLDNDVAPDRIRWVRPRDHWFHHRRHFQPLDLVGENMEAISLDAKAAAEAADIDDLFDRLEASGRLVRIDPSARATMYRITMLSPSEIDPLRQIDDVVRLGRVRSDRSRPDRARAGRDRHWPRRLPRRLHGARPAQRTRDPRLSARPHRAPADQAELADVQRGAHRFRRGPPRRGRRQEPALPAQSLSRAASTIGPA